MFVNVVIVVQSNSNKSSREFSPTITFRNLKIMLDNVVSSASELRSLVYWCNVNGIECRSKNPGGLFSFGDELRLEQVVLWSMELRS